MEGTKLSAAYMATSFTNTILVKLDILILKWEKN
jgi:hypothetical protein